MSDPDGPIAHLVSDFAGKKIDRREFFRRSAALGLTLGAASALLAACGGDEPAAETTPPAETADTGAATTEAATTEAATTEAPTETVAEAEGTLRIRLLNDIITTDPAFLPTAADTLVVQGVYEGLVMYKPGTWEVVNVLAETFEPSPDGLEFRFTLKEGIPFHGGYGELTAEDVKFSFERTAGLTTPPIESPYVGDWAALAEVRVDGPYEGAIVLKEPFAPLMTTSLPFFSGWIVSKKAVEELGEEFATKPIGTGPYEFVEWKPKQEVRVQRFADYGGAAGDLLGTAWDELVFLPIEDDQAVAVALETGELDFAELPLSQIGRFEENGDFTVETRTTVDYNWIGMNMENPKLQDPLVREAIRYAIDVPAIIEGAFEGRYQQATTLIAPGMPIGHWAEAPLYARDVEKAKALLAQAASAPTELEFKAGPETGAKEIGEIVQANLAEVGIDVKITIMDPSAYYALDTEELRGRELFYVGFLTNPDPSWCTAWFTCDQIDVWNWMYWCDEEYTRLHAEALKELDPTARHEMYVEMQKLWDAAIHTVWLAWPTRTFAARAGLVSALRPDGQIYPQSFTET